MQLPLPTNFADRSSGKGVPGLIRIARIRNPQNNCLNK